MSASPVILVQLSPAPGGGLGVSLGGAGRAPVTGWLTGDQAAALQPDPALGQAPMVLLPGQDAGRVATEEAWGQRAAGALLADGRVAVALARALGAAGDGPHPPALALSVPDDTLADLPWELLCDSADGSSLERSGQAVVVRLVPQHLGRAGGTASGGRLRLLTWAPEPDNPAVATILQATHAPVSGEGAALRLPPDLSTLPDPEPDTVDVLHLVCHGSRDLDRLALLLGGDTEATASDATAALLPLLQRCALVLLDICHAGMASTGALGGLGQRLVAAGAPACVAAATTVGVDAAAAFAAGCLAALQTGAPLHAAVAEGRRRVGAQGTDHPEARWHNHRLLVGSTQVLAQPPVVVAGWRPPGFPPDAPEADPLWAAIQGHAETWGFVGLEAVVAGVCGADLPPRLSAGAAVQVAPYRDALNLRLRHLRPAPDAPAGLAVTPRLAAFGASLPPGLPLPALVRALVRLVEESLGPPLPAVPGARAPDAPLLLEVVGGPEDGRRLALHPGQTLGRWSPADPPRCDHGLYQATVRFDPALSRSGVLRAETNGRVVATRSGLWVLRSGPSPETVRGLETLASAHTRAQAEPLPPDTPVALAEGDLLWATVWRPATGGGTPLPLTVLRVGGPA